MEDGSYVAAGRAPLFIRDCAPPAWATGSALHALHQAGDMKTSDAVDQRGVAFPLHTQFEDGSWWVKSRAWPFQPHFHP